LRLRHIEVFHAITQTGSISKAAALLSVSQPAVSKVLQHAEMELGFKLFERVKGRLHPTAEADILYVEVAKLHQGLEQLRMLSDNLRRLPEGHLHIGCLPSLALSIMPKAIHDFCLSYPSVTCEVETNHIETLVPELRARHFDLAVTLFPGEYPGIQSQVLGEVELVYLGPKKGDAINLADLNEKDLIGLSRSDRIGELIANRFETLGLGYKPAIQVQTYYFACALAAAGCGAAIVDELTARSMIRNGLFLRRIKPQMLVTLAVLTHENHVIRGYCTNFMEILKKTIDQSK
jgi:DNA-binding transcriptional LysR family regulator